MIDLEQAVAAIRDGGYHWWYVDGLSDDGRRGFTAIFLVGSVFSPRYASRMRRGERPPATDHLGVHVALYEDGREVAWAMSEYPRSALTIGRGRLGIGRSFLEWADDGTIRGEIDDRSAPIFWTYLRFGRGIRGRFALRPRGTARPPEVELARSAAGEAHRWQVRAPLAALSVAFDRPAFSFEGRGYHDVNWGEGRLEAAFSRWAWARVGDAHASRVLYAVEPRRGHAHGYVLCSDEAQSVLTRAPARFGALGKLKWGLHAPAGFELGDTRAELVQVLDRSPFYARYVAEVAGQRGVGEYLDLERFVRPGVQFLLHFRTHRQSR